METNIIKCTIMSKGLVFRFELNNEKIIESIESKLNDLLIDYTKNKHEIVITQYNEYKSMWEFLFKLSCEYDVLIQ